MRYTIWCMQRLRRQKVHALVVSRRDAGEADRRVLLFTRPYGLLRVIAKGVRRIPSRRGGHLEPLTHVVATLSGQAGHYYVGMIESYDEYPSLHQDPQALEIVQRLLHVVVGLFGESDPQPELFDALHQACVALPTLAVAKQYTLEVAISLYALGAAGLLPQFDRCQVCGTSKPQEAVVLRPHEGGWRCLLCHDSFHGTQQSLSPRLLAVLRWLAQYPQRALRLAIDDTEAHQLVSAMRSYVRDMQVGQVNQVYRY